MKKVKLIISNLIQRKTVLFFLLFLLSIGLFILSQPNPLNFKGIWIFAWFILIPILIIIDRISPKKSFLYGFIYGIIACILYSFWLVNYYVLSLILVALYEGVLYGIVFYLLKKSFIVFNKYSFIVQCLIWCSFEYFRTIGFLGVNYGVIGYSQWSNLILLQSADLFGIQGINFIIIFPSCYLVSLLKSHNIKKFIKIHRLSLIGYVSSLLFLIVYGVVKINKTIQFDIQKKICLIQNNIDTHIYYKNEKDEILDYYKQLLNTKLKDVSNIDLIVFPEEAVRPRILLNKEDTVTQKMYQDIIDYLNFFYSLKVPIVFGSTSLEYDSARKGDFTYRAYNISCFLKNKIQTIPPEIEVYKKRHLVPIIEKIPFVNIYQKRFNAFSDCLSSGNDPVIFNLDEVSFCTPICFEESFGYDVRSFMKNNPSFILSISSDLWSKSLVCQYQHLAMEVFRAVENRIPFLRSSVTGQTVYINPKGICEQTVEPFTSSVLICDVPLSVNPRKTIYSYIGDSLGVLWLILCVLLFIIKYIKKYRRKEVL
ncbi:apolipoprotein N-acyltransferase [Treponema bryantii]|uniref:apolipoprotein N-acyltransferase n=1 Tax=Treponema bryantii TaxID=163 RepID=UPI002B2CA706|nr:apolipoprotein N-acyltransferase 1 [Treponema bryantii]